MDLFPTSVALSNGGESHITIADDENFSLCTDKGIRIICKEAISIKGKSILLSAPAEVSLLQSGKVGEVIEDLLGDDAAGPNTGGVDGCIISSADGFDIIGTDGTIIYCTLPANFNPFNDAPTKGVFIPMTPFVATLGILACIVAVAVCVAAPGVGWVLGGMIVGAVVGTSVAACAVAVTADAAGVRASWQTYAVAMIAGLVFGATAGAMIGSLIAFAGPIIKMAKVLMRPFIEPILRPIIAYFFNPIVAYHHLTAAITAAVALAGNLTAVGIVTVASLGLIDALGKSWAAGSGVNPVILALAGGDMEKYGEAEAFWDGVMFVNNLLYTMFMFMGATYIDMYGDDSIPITPTNELEHDETFDQLNTDVNDLQLEDGTWEQDALSRGKSVDEQAGNNLGSNFPTIDKQDENGVITSIKSRDLSAQSYQNGNTLERTIRNDIDAVANFNGRDWNNVEVTADSITGRQLEIVVPNVTMTDTQIVAINNAIAYGEEMGVTVIITVGH